jgi:hydroxyacylglutathione hydrolase
VRFSFVSVRAIRLNACFVCSFTGDAIINGGVGAFFHGDAKDCYDNLHVRLKAVPDEALVFSGHEYMLMNLRFSHWLDDSNEHVAAALREVATRRHHHFTTQPSSMAVERRVNPFFRVKERVFLDKIDELYAAMRRSARKKWYRRYIPEWLDRTAFVAAVEGPDKRDAEMRKLGRKIGTGTDFADVNSMDGDVPSVLECVKGIKTCQELIQYRHAIEQSAGAGGGGSEASGGGGDEDDEPPTPPDPGPVHIG